MAGIKESLIDTKLTKKNFGSQANENVRHLKQTILKLKANTQIKNDTLIVKTTIFDVPKEVWRSGFDAFQTEQGGTTSFKDYNKSRDNPDFVRDFNLACSRQAHLNLVNTVTKDQVVVNKGFLDSMFFDNSASQQDDSDGQQKYAHLASDESLNADGIDFSDPVALLRRQRMILEQIEEHKVSQTGNFDPLKLLRKTSNQVEDDAADAATQD